MKKQDVKKLLERYDREYRDIVKMYCWVWHVPRDIAELTATALIVYYHGKAMEHAYCAHYLSILGGLPLEDAERIHAGIHTGYDQYEPIRIRAFLERIFAFYQGSTSIPLEQLLNDFWTLERRFGAYSTPTPAYIIADGIVQWYAYDAETDSVGDARLVEAEEKLAAELKKVDSFYIDEFPEIADAAVADLGLALDNTQAKTPKLLERGVSILTGGPGTGKTTCCRLLVDIAERLGKSVILCAPTGAAAKRLSEATGREAATVHRTLGLVPYMEGGYLPSEDLPRGCVCICDETSMLDVDLARVLVESVRLAEGQIVFVGDEDQLPSVGPGRVLGDLIESGRFPAVRLSTVHRQDPDSSICKNAALIKSGTLTRDGRLGLYTDGPLYTDNLNFSTTPGTYAKSYKDETELFEDAILLYSELTREFSPDDVRIFCPVKEAKYDEQGVPKYPISCQYINLTIHNDRKGELQEFRRKTGTEAFSYGDVITVTRNNYNLGVVNGDVGRITFASADAIQAEIDGRKITFEGEDLADIALAFSVSVHRGQGSQVDGAAIVLIPDRPVVMLQKRLLYTAITRAKSRLYILYMNNALCQAARDTHTTERKTALLEKLEGRRKRK